MTVCNSCFIIEIITNLSTKSMTYFCSTGPNKSSAGLSSASGLPVSTVVLAIARKNPLAAILWVCDTTPT